jgi:hypothetical protein
MPHAFGHIDWTGVEPDRSPVRPLDAQTFTERLTLLSERAESLTVLRKAFTEQHPGRNRARTASLMNRPMSLARISFLRRRWRSLSIVMFRRADISSPIADGLDLVEP